MPISECFFWHVYLCIMWTLLFLKHIDLLFYLIELIYWCVKKDYFVFLFFSKIYSKCKIKRAHRQTIQCVSFRSSWGCSYSSTGKQLYLHRSISFLLNHFPFKCLPCKLYRYVTVAVLAQWLEYLTAQLEVAGSICRARPLLNIKTTKKCGYCLCSASG